MNDCVKYIEIKHSWTDPWEDREVNCGYQFRKPSRSEINRFNKEVAKSASTAQNNLLIGIIHEDDADRLKRELEEYPGLLMSLAAYVLKACGFGDLGN